MKTVFVGGSRRVTRLDSAVTARLRRVTELGLRVIVGDANGADRAAQQALVALGYGNVSVFCTGEAPRNNLGRWPVHAIAAPTNARKDRSFYTAKDRAMTEEADFGLMIWDGESAGTLANVLRLLRRGKKVVVYVTAAQQAHELRSLDDWAAFAAPIEVALLTAIEAHAGPDEPQASLLTPLKREARAS